MTKEASSLNILSCDSIEQIILAQCYSKKLSKTSPSQILFAKPEYYGVSGIALEWFRSYLCNMSQFVMYRDTDLPAVLKHSQCILVADDSTVYISGTNEPVLRQLIRHSRLPAGNALWFCQKKIFFSSAAKVSG